VKPEPFRIEPAFVPRIWGARSLAPLYSEKSNLPEPIGEVWLTGVDCKVASGPFAGKTLGEAWRQMPPEWRGTRFAESGDFPILVKFIFPNDKLSIQVHPDDAYAAAHEQAAGGRGKTEMWHVVQAESGANVLVGTKPGVTKQQFLEAIANRTVESLLERHSLYNGDTLFVPAGTPHTIGPGMILCEVQEYSDLTYRLYDFGRTDANGKPRQLHVQKALDVLQCGKIAGGKIPSLPRYSGSYGKGGKRTLLSACRHFAVERWEFYKSTDTFVFPKSIGAVPREGLQFDIRIVLSGQGEMHWSEGSADFQASQCWFVPACAAVARSTTRQTVMLHAHKPDLATLRSELEGEGHAEAAIAQTVFD
jgi:mannose-6-phosphate isomerase